MFMLCKRGKTFSMYIHYLKNWGVNFMIFYLKINRCERMMILEKYKTFFCKGVIKKVNANTPTVDVYLCNTAIVWIGYLIYHKVLSCKYFLVSKHFLNQYQIYFLKEHFNSNINYAKLKFSNKMFRLHTIYFW